MYITQIDDLINDLLNKFNKYLLDEKFFNKINSDSNFVKFQNIILTTIKKFIDNINTKEILNIIKKESLLEFILNIIKRYCAFYIYLGIAYNYKDGRDLFIINLIECSKYQKDSIILVKIRDLFNTGKVNIRSGTTEVFRYTTTGYKSINIIKNYFEMFPLYTKKANSLKK